MSQQQSLLGKTARVTATVTDSQLGEVVVSIRQGSEHYFAYAAEAGDRIDKGAEVLVVAESPGRTVYVSRTS